VVLDEYVKGEFLPWPRLDEPEARRRPLEEAFADGKVQQLVGQFMRDVVRALVPGIPLPGISNNEP
jgi:hypothetical protein